MTVKVTRVSLMDDHEDSKWLILEGSIDGVPQVTKRRTISSAALVSGDLTIADEKAQLVADVEEYHARFLAVQEAVKGL
jgi:hypothetical protein